jgi:multiple sugar transport system ATP-binding protein
VADDLKIHERFIFKRYKVKMNFSKAVKVVGITKAFDQTQVLKNLSIDIQPGEFISLVGASGCGKSTLLRVIAGLEHQDAGQVIIGDSVVDDLLPKERNVAMVFQNYALYPHMTVMDNIATPLRMSRLTWWQRLPYLSQWIPSARRVEGAIRQEVQTLCQSLKFEALMQRKPAQLSGGQRQRVALARAMIRQPAVFLMDEPLSNLDAKLRVHLRNELVDLHQRLGITFVYVTHDQSEAMTMSDRIAVMVDGEILQIGTPAELYKTPNSLQVAQFIGTPQINVFPLARTSNGAYSFGQLTLEQLALAPNAEVLALRPEHLVLEAELLAACDVQTLARVDRIEHHGSELLIYLHVEGFEDVVSVSRLPNDGKALSFSSGQTLTVGFAIDHALLFDAGGQRVSVS